MKTYFLLQHISFQKTVAISLLLFAAACAKAPGEGGAAVLLGKVETILLQIDEIRISPDSIVYDTTILDRYPSPEEKVFLIYGDDDVHDDDTKTDYRGQYRFTDLYKGKYRLFAYSECYDCPAGKAAEFQEVEIKVRSLELEVPTILIKKFD